MTTVNKSVLSKAINTASKAVGANPILPLLSNILLESNNGSSRAAATNLEIGVGYTFPSEGEEFRICVPAKTISGLVDALQDEEVELTLNEEDQSIMVMTESSTSNIRCAPPDEFPDIPKVSQPTFSMGVALFKEMVQRVAFCASQDDTGNTLNGVQLSVKGKKLTMFAVDRFHFSYEETTLSSKVKGASQFVVKGSTLEATSKLLPDEGELEIQVEENKVMFHCGEVDVITQLMNGQFPDHERLQAALGEPTVTMTISTRELLRASRQLRVFASEVGTSRLEVKGTLVKYSTLTQDKGDSDITFAVVKKGADILIGLNVHMLYEFLEVCKTEFLTVETANNRSPIVFRMKGVDNFYHEIMPIIV